MSKSVAILYGWAEGPGHGKLLRAELRKAGFRTIRKASEADIIITHSGGALILPKHFKAGFVMLVGLPYWPGQHPARGLARKIKIEFENSVRLSGWLKKTFYNSLYLLRVRRHYRMVKAYRRRDYPLATRSCSFIAVRNRHDPFMHPQKTIELGERKSWNLLSLPGTHDDIWVHPDKYVALLSKKVR